ncbi:alkaline phosphatase PafA [Albibacterium sp.]|uniref:alkaline phosphatase PafA n=1 Tax=Albibacterium sp. TaxID=2952885 RepID=UPI002C8511C6|nr:alkaline phosphatase PafA [Albibacterium sp.]HUH18341.1 alkaline phosphatase PafA [Albibacterium sp.]
MMRKHKPYNFIAIAIIALILISSTSFAQKSEKLPRPKLVVGIVVDQMRWDYLYRYYDRYGNDGFKRMINEGFSADNTNIDYVPTVTAIGHTTIYTGSVPSIHGIAGNDFIINATGETMYCTEDSTVSTVGSTSDAGKMSPRNLLASTITDELKLATNFRSKVIGVAIKDRGSILPAGHAADAAYWFDGETGNFITSTYYMDKLPAWVEGFNQQKLVEKYLNQGWETLYPIASYVQSAADDNRYEGKFSVSEKPVFPVNTAELYKKSGAGAIRTSPYGNTISFDMAKAAVENEKLGQNVVTDFLALSLSSTDYIGHQFGPNAIEVEDTYLRLDNELAEFFKYLDEKVGAGEYTVFLSADHGGAHNVNFLKDHNIPAGAWGTGKILTELNKVLQAKFGEDKLVISLLNYQGHLNYKVIEEKGLDKEAIKSVAIDFLRKQEGVTYVVDMDKAQTASVPKVIRERIINGYNYDRSGDIQVILNPAWYSSGSANPTGTSHAAWNPYDAHIPLIFMGWGVKPGKTSRPTGMTDVAATLAAILKIQQPNGSIGVPIMEAIK